jgi:hypothetical protein
MLNRDGTTLGFPRLHADANSEWRWLFLPCQCELGSIGSDADEVAHGLRKARLDSSQNRGNL